MNFNKNIDYSLQEQQQQKQQRRLAEAPPLRIDGNNNGGGSAGHILINLKQKYERVCLRSRNVICMFRNTEASVRPLMWLN